ncbi:DUF58 domain-containing protein [Bifidobacterium pullorum]|uniref:DUF58 domain-containing protein n=1 Tax=Bifidobacterium pullorum TaxID=78448 RepID=UPI001EF4138D|nr:DUF58 domain-containing protein [Bifidobacterium pullorum]
MGVVEGEHASHRPLGSGDMMDARVYEPGDEARLIDWKTSARMGRPMVVNRERLVTSRVWLLMDVGREMTGICPSGERALEVAANGLRMFAALSLRRADTISLVFADAASITRVPFTGGFAQFGRALDGALERDWNQPRNIDALLDYARRIKDREALVVLATDEHALGRRHLEALRRIARTHPVVLIDVATLNPFAARAPQGYAAVADGAGARRVPAFLRTARTQAEVTTHREAVAAMVERELARSGSRMIRAGSSEAMFDAFVAMVSRAVAGSSPAVPRGALAAAGDAR